MSTGEFQFRSSAFGFNRKDVIQYIEAVHQSYAARLRKAEKALEEERTTRRSAEEQHALAGQKAAAADEDAQRARESMEDALQALEAIRRERDELQLRLQTLEKDYNDLRIAAEQMAPAARAYESLKEKSGQIEMEARTRAEGIVREGERQAAATRQEVADWIRTVDSSYARLKSDVAATLSHTIGELERTGRSLNGVTQELESHGLQFQAISETDTPSAEGQEPAQ